MTQEVDVIVARIKADATQLEIQMRRANGVVKQNVGDMGNSLSTLRGQFLALGSAVSLGQLIKSIASFEKIEASLRTVTGSATEAALALDMIQKFAATNPFGLEEAAQGFIKLTALGLTPSEAALRSYGNTASAMGKSLNQMIEAVADASTGEFERLKEFGITARQQGDSVTFTFQGVSTKVSKSAAEIEEYLRKIGDVNFAGAMKEQEGTVSTALSNMSDGFGRLAKAIGDAGVSSLIIGIAHAIQDVTDAATSSIPVIERWLKGLSEITAKPSANAKWNMPGDSPQFQYGPYLPKGTLSDERPSSVDYAVFTGAEQYGPNLPAAPRARFGTQKNDAADATKKAREALDDYNRSLQEEHTLLGLSDRDAVAQEARFRTEEIARRGHIKLTQEQIDANVNLALSNYDLKKAQDEVNKAIQEAARFQQELHDKLSATLTDIAFKADSAADAMLGFAESIARAAFEKRIAGPLADALIGTGGSKGFLDDAISGVGSLFGGFFADGGSPPVGLPSVVGERGPEIFVPKTAGTIVPNHNLGGTTVIVQQTIQVNPGVPELINARIREAAPVIAAQAQAAVFSEMQKGGAGARITGLRN